MPTIKNLETKRKFLFSVRPRPIFQTGSRDLGENPDNLRLKVPVHQRVSQFQLAQPTDDALGEVAGGCLAAQIRRANAVLAQDLINGGSETVRELRPIDMLKH